MTTKEYNAIIETLREYIEDLEGETSYQIEHGITARKMVEGGFFACTNYQALEEMREWYGEDFDESRYLTKDGNDWKYRNGTPYVWAIYTAKVAQAIEKLNSKNNH